MTLGSLNSEFNLRLLHMEASEAAESHDEQRAPLQT